VKNSVAFCLGVDLSMASVVANFHPL
jgi:hypothetical protein